MFFSQTAKDVPVFIFTQCVCVLMLVQKYILLVLADVMCPLGILTVIKANALYFLLLPALLT